MLWFWHVNSISFSSYRNISAEKVWFSFSVQWGSSNWKKLFSLLHFHTPYPALMHAKYLLNSSNMDRVTLINIWKPSHNTWSGSCWLWVMHLAERTVLSKERPRRKYVPVLDHMYLSSDLLPLLLIFGPCWQVVRSSLADAARAPWALPEPQQDSRCVIAL